MDKLAKSQIEKLRKASSTFLEMYPGGFENAELIVYTKKFKSPKLEQTVADTLSYDACKYGLGAASKQCEALVQIVNRASMVSMFDKRPFKEFIAASSSEVKAELAQAMLEFLHQDEAGGFARLLGILKAVNLAKWTYMSIFKVLAKPNEEVLIKPNTVKSIIKYFEFTDLLYRPGPSYDFYRRYRAKLNEMKKYSDPSLAPDNLAYQGFLWTITGQ